MYICQVRPSMQILSADPERLAHRSWRCSPLLPSLRGPPNLARQSAKSALALTQIQKRFSPRRCISVDERAKVNDTRQVFVPVTIFFPMVFGVTRPAVARDRPIALPSGSLGARRFFLSCPRMGGRVKTCHAPLACHEQAEVPSARWSGC
jgi:hypothetical protein